MTETAEDGRVARGQRTREAVIDTLLGLYAEGNLTPTMEEIAARVGRTTRAIYHHFQDKEALAVAIATTLLERHLELFTARPITGTRTERIDGIVTHRAELFEAVAPARRSRRRSWTCARSSDVAARPTRCPNAWSSSCGRA